MTRATLNDIRAAFLDFFKRNGHTVVSSAPLVPKDDPTLMFVNAGMVPFKNVFTGMEKRDYSRAASSQKCVRAGGKHNDLDNVGYTARHHTFFEMLGNFSFGDYFKEEAILYGWEFLTKDMGLPPEKLCVTVYHDDDFAWNQWKKITGFPDHKIIRISTSDNFWSMGDTGPCGPCSEIFYDHGDAIPGGPPGSPDADGDRFVEIWNLVFMQFEQLADGNRINLPKPSIDTGMGLERISTVIQGVHDNYEIDLFKNLIATIKREAATIGGQAASEPAPYKVIADHLRASCFLLADGVDPSNEGRGYVLRRIMRRAMRYAHQLGCEEPLMHRLVPALVSEMDQAYPELKRAEATVTETLRSEEERFKQTLGRGLKLLEEESANLSKNGILSGEVAFKLYDTYGFPLDLTQDLLRTRGIGVDVAGFEQHMEQQRERARDAWKGSGEEAVGKMWFELKEKVGATTFTGYHDIQAKSKVLAIIKDGKPTEYAATGEVYLVFDQTPFYGESGGQVGDEGILTPDIDTEEHHIARIIDTQKPLEDFIIHKAVLKYPLQVGQTITASVDFIRRNKIRANHSATHLLHKALRNTLGEHVTQKGSLVAPDRLRFDFSHGKAVTKEELRAIEQQVNTVIQQQVDVCTEEMHPEAAIQAGAMALFGEKYGEKVRVLSMGNDRYSVELCGGTHVRNTGDIGMFAITSEGSVAAGIRRIEAVTGEAVRDYFKDSLVKQVEQLQKLEADHAALIANLAEVGHAVPPRKETAFSLIDIDLAKPKELFSLYSTLSNQLEQESLALQELNKKLSKELAKQRTQQALNGANEAEAEVIGDINFIAKIVQELPPKELRPLADSLLKQATPGIAIAATEMEGKASLVVAVSKEFTDKHDAVTLVKLAVAELGGQGGGGKPELAQGGGPDASRLPTAIDAIRARLR